MQSWWLDSNAACNMIWSFSQRSQFDLITAHFRCLRISQIWNGKKEKKREKWDTGVSSFHNSSKDRFFFQFCFSDFIWRSLIGKFCRNFSRKIYFYLQWLGRILGPVSSFLICHFLYLCAICAWRTAFPIPVWLLCWCYFQQLLLLSHRAAPVQLKTISVNCSKHLNHFIILPTVDATR